jgi:hypothetical protein
LYLSESIRAHSARTSFLTHRGEQVQ